SFVAVSTCFPDSNEVVVDIGETSDVCVTGLEDHADFFGRHLDLSVITIETDDIRAGSGRSHSLSAFFWVKFDVVDVETNRDVLKLQSISCLNFCFWSGDQFIANLDSFWCEMIFLVTILVGDQHDVGCSDWIVFNGCYDTGDVMILYLFKVNRSIASGRTSSAMSASDRSGVISSGMFFQALYQALQRF